MESKTKLPPIREREFMTQVIQLAKIRGWRTFHQRPARTASGGWVSAVQGDGVGFPDLVLVKRGSAGVPGRIIFAELKRDRRQELTTDQANWLWVLESAGMQTAVWCPEDWKLIEEILS